MGYTKTNLKDDVEDQAVKFGMPHELQARFARRPIGGKSLGLTHFTLDPGFRIPFGHRHGNHEEVFLVLSGSGRAKLDGEVHELKQWDALRVGSPVARGFAAGPEGMELLVIGFGPGGDAEMLDGYWDET